MNEFVYQNTVKLIYGQNGLNQVINEIKKYGSKVLLVMGGSSFINNGHYSKFVNALENEHIEHIDFGGHKIPSLKKVRDGIKICKEEKIDCVIGIGGGTCMDIAKTIAFGAKQEYDVWQYLIGAQEVDGANHLPVGTIVTYPSSGSEMDGATQITNDETKEQVGLSEVYPNFSWINPQYIMSLDKKALAYAQITSFVQISIAYLGLEKAAVSEGVAVALMKTIIDNLEKALENPEDEEARGNLMVSSALNVSGITSLGKDGDWSMYPLEGIMQNYYEVEYTKAITTIFPYWVKHIYGGQTVFKSYFKDVFNIELRNKSDEQILREGLERIFSLYRKFNIATCFKEIKERTLDEEVLRNIIATTGELPSQYVHFTLEKIEKLIFDSINGFS